MNPDLILVLGILLSTASQLRPAGAPIGPGEVCFVIWIALMLCRGLSENPTQLAILCAVLGLLCLHLADVAASASERIAAIAAAVLPIYVGRLTKSDTFALVLVAAGPIFFALKMRAWLLTRQPR